MEVQEIICCTVGCRARVDSLLLRRQTCRPDGLAQQHSVFALGLDRVCLRKAAVRKLALGAVGARSAELPPRAAGATGRAFGPKDILDNMPERLKIRGFADRLALDASRSQVCAVPVLARCLCGAVHTAFDDTDGSEVYCSALSTVPQHAAANCSPIKRKGGNVSAALCSPRCVCQIRLGAAAPACAVLDWQQHICV